MQAVIPAAGEGTRLRPLTADRPKPLVEVGGEPLLAHCLEALRPLEPEEVIVVVGEGGGRIRRRFGRRHGGLALRYARQPRPEGLARALLAAAPRLRGDFAVHYADNVIRADLRTVVRRHLRRGVAATLVTEQVPPEEARQGVCLLDDNGRLTRIVEHPGPGERAAGLVVAGFAVYAPAVLDACRRVEPSREGEYELTDAVNLLLEGGRPVETVPLAELGGRRVNVNTPRDLERAERLLARLEGPSAPS